MRSGLDSVHNAFLQLLRHMRTCAIADLVNPRQNRPNDILVRYPHEFIPARDGKQKVRILRVQPHQQRGHKSHGKLIGECAPGFTYLGAIGLPVRGNNYPDREGTSVTATHTRIPAFPSALVVDLDRRGNVFHSLMKLAPASQFVPSRNFKPTRREGIVVADNHQLCVQRIVGYRIVTSTDRRTCVLAMVCHCESIKDRKPDSSIFLRTISNADEKPLSQSRPLDAA